MSNVATDVVIVGSGAAGLVAAVTARSLGLDVILLESTNLLGGSTSLSTGSLWLPGHRFQNEPDSYADILAYLNADRKSVV